MAPSRSRATFVSCIPISRTPSAHSLRTSLSAARPRRRITCTAAPSSTAAMAHPDIKRMHRGPRFNQVVVHNGVVYVAGQVARGTDGTPGAQTTAILHKIDRLLMDAGTDKSRVLSATVWMTDIAGVAEMNAAWEAWVDKDNMPVRATVQAALVADDVTVEIQVTAALPSLAKTLATDRAASAVGPYNQGIVIEDGTVYVSGCVGLMPGDKGMVDGGVEEQTGQALKNVKAILEEAGAAPRDIVKTTILLDDMSEFGKVNKIYEAFFEGGRVPARSCFAAKELPKGALIEVEAIAKLSRT